MRATRANVCLYLGRHETPHSGLWTYGRALVRALLQANSGNGRELFRLHCYCGGGEGVRQEWEELKTEFPDRLTGNFLAATGFGRRGAVIADLLLRPPRNHLVHGTANLVPIAGQGPRFLTLHDLLQAYPVGESDLYRSFRGWTYRALFGQLIPKADVVVTDHERTAADIRQTFPAVRRVQVIYPGLDPVFLGSDGSVLRARRADDGRRFRVLAFASGDPRKNIEAVIDGVSRIAGQQKAVEITVVASGQGVERRVRELSSSPNVRLTVQSGVPREEMPKLFAWSDLLCFPSKAEGFGYPVYESLSQGTPVVASKGILVAGLRRELEALVAECDPDAPESVAAAIAELQSRDIVEDARRDVAGVVRQRLDFAETASRMADLYREFGV